MIRTLLVLACLVVFAGCLLAMRHGWKGRARRQNGVAELPPPPADLGTPLLEPMTGLYVGTTTAGQWQDRIVAHGLGARAQAIATLYRRGLLVERNGTDALFVPAAALRGVGVGAGLAGKVMGPGGLLIVRWQLADHAGAVEVDTGLRADDKSVYPAWVDQIDGMLDARGVREEQETDR